MKCTGVMYVIGSALAVLLLSGCGRNDQGAVNAVSPSASAAVVKPDFTRLTGRWLRPDGGYILEVRSVDANGLMAAGYFNPRPINVSKAQASVENTALKMFVELRDVNYPGSTYNLVYHPSADRLIGTYYQAVEKRTFEVFFVRSDKP
jgi:hypothetical protein